MRSLRVFAWWLVDLAVVAAAIACILHISRRSSVSCDWRGMHASCVLEAEDSLGRVHSRTIAGIRGVAYLDGTHVGLVTDAQHKDTSAFFGTSEIEAPTEAEAERLHDFADDREPDHYGWTTGVAHPRLTTALLLLGLLLYGFVSGRMRRVVGGEKAADV